MISADVTAPQYAWYQPSNAAVQQNLQFGVPTWKHTELVANNASLAQSIPFNGVNRVGVVTVAAVDTATYAVREGGCVLVSGSTVYGGACSAQVVWGTANFQIGAAAGKLGFLTALGNCTINNQLGGQRAILVSVDWYQ
jgi:hypothetical protein